MKYIFILLLLGISISTQAVDLTVGGVGDGVTDDTVAVQTSLTDCSINGKTCVIGAGKNHKVTGYLYMYGAANLRGTDADSTLSWTIVDKKYPLQMGLSSAGTLAAAWTGTISDVKLKLNSATVTACTNGCGRIIWLARASNATITRVYFDIGTAPYSATGSGVDASFLANAGNYIRTNLTVSSNTIYALGTSNGSEGFGLEGWNTALFEYNVVFGVGDDIIGIHLMCTNITIQDNNLSGVDGRIYISNSQGVKVRRNTIARQASPVDGLWYAASSLLFVGHETAATNSNTAPKDITVTRNTFIYPEGAKDSAAAIYMQGPRNTGIYGNDIYNYSSVLTGRCIYQVPFDFTGTWTDPDGLDTTPAKVRDLTIRENHCLGTYPKAMVMTGAGANHIAPITIVDNVAPSTQYYAPAVVTNQMTEMPRPRPFTSSR